MSADEDVDSREFPRLFQSHSRHTFDTQAHDVTRSESKNKKQLNYHKMSITSSIPKDILEYILTYCNSNELVQVSQCSKLLGVCCERTAIRILHKIKKYHYKKLYQEERQQLLSCLYVLNELSKQKIILVGGGNLDEGLDSYRKCNLLRLDSMKWSQCTLMSQRRGLYTTESIAFNGLAFVISGDDHTACGTIEAYSPLSNKWIDSLPNLPRRLVLGSGAAWNDTTLYYSGGLDKSSGQKSSDIYTLSIINDTNEYGEWKLEELKLVTSRYGHSSYMYKNRLFVAGGQLSLTESNNTTTDSIDPLINTAATSTNDSDLSTLTYSKSVEIYDFVKKSMITSGSMKVARIFFRLLLVNDILYAVGGDVNNEGKHLVPSIERYNNCTNAWDFVTVFPELRRVYTVTATEGKIYVLGGRDEFYGTLTDWDEYSITADEWASQSSSFSSSSREYERVIPREAFYGGSAVTIPSVPYSWTISAV